MLLILQLYHTIYMTSTNQNSEILTILDCDISNIHNDNFDSLKSEIAQLKQELEAAKNDANLKNMQLVSQRNINKNSETHNELQKKRIGRLEETIANMKREADQLKTPKEQSHISVSQNTISVARLEALEDTINSLQNQIQTYKVNAENQTALIEELQIRTSDQNMLIDDLRHENDLLQKDNQRHNATIDELNDKLAMQKDELASRNTETSTLKRQLQRSKIATGSTPSPVKNLEARDEKLTKQKNQLQTRVTELQKKVRQLEAEALESTKKLKTSESQVTEANKKLKTAQSQLKEANRAISDLKLKYKELEQTNRQSVNRVSKIRPQEQQKPADKQKQKQMYEDIDLEDDDQALVFPNKHKQEVDRITTHLKSLYDWKDRISFLNIMGAMAETMIDEMSNASMME